LAHTTQDDAFHEIQLNGKQLFFLFMAATVVSVVIFLSGVLVGRGVRAERLAVAENEALNLSPTADQPQPSSAMPPTAAGADLTIVPPPPPADEIGNVQPTPTVEDVKPSTQPKAPEKPATTAAEKPAEKPAAKPSEPTTKAAPPSPVTRPQPTATTTPVPAATSVPAGVTGGWVVQVAALNSQSEANLYAADLTKKGYEAFVASPQPGTSVYRVRIGRFNTRGEAQGIADKLSKTGVKQPWVTR
jgi:cell division septation protein DedD